MGEWSPNMLVIGKMSSGKSFVCDILLGEDKFSSRTSRFQHTFEVKTLRSIYQLKGCKYFSVTDTPDFQTPAGTSEVRKIKSTFTYERTFLVYVANWNHILADLLGSSECVNQQLGVLSLDLNNFRGSVAVLTHVPKDTPISSDKMYRYLDSKFNGNVETIIQDIFFQNVNRQKTAEQILRHLGLYFAESSLEMSLTAGSSDSLQSMDSNDTIVRDKENIGAQTSRKAIYEEATTPDSNSLTSTQIEKVNVGSQHEPHDDVPEPVPATSDPMSLTTTQTEKDNVDTQHEPNDVPEPVPATPDPMSLTTTQTEKDNVDTQHEPNVYRKAEAWLKARKMGKKAKTQSVTDPRPKTTDHTRVSDEDIAHFKKTLKRGKSKNSHVPVIVVGPRGAGKTALIHNLIGQPLKKEKKTACFEVRRFWSKLYRDEDGKLIRRETTKRYEEDLNHHTMANAVKSVESCAECEEVHCNVNTTKRIQLPVYTTQTSIDLENDDLASDEFRGNDATSQILNVGKEDIYSVDKLVENLDMVYIKNVLCKKEHSLCDYIYVSYLDFSGDYYNLHQPYMRPNAFYLVVLDLSEPLDALMKESESSKGFQGILRHKVTDCLMYWLTSIYTYTTSNQREPPNVFPPVLVICTHGENIKSDEDKDKCLKEIWKHINKSPVAKGHVKDVLIVSNTPSPKTEFDDILECILKHADERAGFRREISAQWIYLEKIILERKHAGSKKMTFAETESIDASSVIPVGNSSRLRTFLKYQHEQGNLIYFDTEELRDLIILDTALLIEFIQCLVKASPFSSPKLQERLQEYMSPVEGLVDDVYIQECTEHATKEVENLKDYFIKIALVYDVLQKFRQDVGRGGQYIIPGYLPTQPLEEVMYIHQNRESTWDIVINFNSPSPPVGHFHRLVFAGFCKWQVIKLHRNNGGLYLGYVRFSLEENKKFWLHMYLRTGEILIKGEYVSRNMKCVERYVIEVLNFLQKQIQEMPRAYGEKQKATLVVRCPEHDTEISLEKLIRNKSEECTGIHLTHFVNMKHIVKDRSKTKKQERLHKSVLVHFEVMILGYV
ncbi:hypothetical protein ACJMK2_033988 [Sinanodonta woodiana]|uniref:Uncharacterized protein n=1 Tax=Sinanodonta woodiana TaxID=1069815 RepID=A0ABD3WQ60_SINWO